MADSNRLQGIRFTRNRFGVKDSLVWFMKRILLSFDGSLSKENTGLLFKDLIVYVKKVFLHQPMKYPCEVDIKLFLLVLIEHFMIIMLCAL